MARLYDPRSIGTITSSTLAWTPPARGENPENAVPVGVGGPLWCRSSQHAVWVSGAVIDGRCHLPFFGNVIEADDYQLLVSVNGSSRLVHLPWDNLVAIPPKPVTTPDMLLAVRPDPEGGTVLPGYVDPKDRRAHFLKGDQAIRLGGGLLVIEEEPIAYRLSDVRLSDKTKRSYHEEVLREFVMENPTGSDMDISREVSFLSSHRTYFGRVRGTIMGLFASISGPDTIPVNITWGVDNHLDHDKKHIVTYHLPSGTKVHVRLIAIVRSLEGSYGGLLTSLYRDGVELHRRIAGLHTERRLSELRAEFSQTTYISDSSPVPELPPHSRVLLFSSTTTAAPSPPRGREFPLTDSNDEQFLPRPQHSVNSASVGARYSIAVLLSVTSRLC